MFGYLKKEHTVAVSSQSSGGIIHIKSIFSHFGLGDRVSKPWLRALTLIMHGHVHNLITLIDKR